MRIATRRGLFPNSAAGRVPPALAWTPTRALYFSGNMRTFTGNTLSHSFYDDTIERWANKTTRSVSLKQLAAHGTPVTFDRVIASANFVSEELPIRLAKELRNLEILPFIMMKNPHMNKVFDIYYSSFKRLITFGPVNNHEDNERFVVLLNDLVGETVNIVELLGKGVIEAYRRVPPDLLSIQVFLDGFLTSRIGRRVLADQHIQLSTNTETTQSAVGIINPQCSPAECVTDVISIVQEMCETAYGIYPVINVVGDTEATVPFIAHHLRYMMIEILKNSVRATVEFHRAKSRRYFPDLPEVTVQLVEGPKYVTVRVSDRGGGMPEEVYHKAFNYGYSTVSDLIERRPESGLGVLGTSSDELHHPLAGLGFGLPLTRLYARHFGGSFDLVSIENYGTDAIVRLDKSGEKLEERQL